MFLLPIRNFFIKRLALTILKPLAAILLLNLDSWVALWWLLHFVKRLLLVVIYKLLGSIRPTSQSSAEVELFWVESELGALVLFNSIWCRDHNSLRQEHDLLIFLIEGLFRVLKWTHEGRLRYFASSLVWTIGFPFFLLLASRVPLIRRWLSLARYLRKLYDWVVAIFLHKCENIAFIRRSHRRDVCSTLSLSILAQTTACNVLQFLSADLCHLLLLWWLESAIFQLDLVYHEQILTLILRVVDRFDCSFLGRLVGNGGLELLKLCWVLSLRLVLRDLHEILLTKW